MSGAAPRESRYDAIYRIVRRIPAGKVATYGQIAALAGLATGARLVGYALHALPGGSSVPWHRVVNAHGALSLIRSSPAAGVEQRIRLTREGVTFDARGRVVLERCLWRPRWDQKRTVPARPPRRGRPRTP